jgi:uncharacterized protein (TIGR03435 family)
MTREMPVGRPFIGIVFSVILGFSVPLLGQSQPEQKTFAFEVASIKPTTQLVFGLRRPPSPDRYVQQSVTLSELLRYAYDVSAFQVEGGEDWTRTSRFDVEAKAAERPTAEQMRMLVKHLLTERFHLSVHTETRERPRYRLLKSRADGRLGDHLQPSNFDCAAITSAPDYKLPSGLTAQGEVPPCIVMLRVNSAGTPTITMRGVSISRLTRVLQDRAGRVVTDKTGLTGTYDIEYETELPSAPGPAAPSSHESLSLFTVLEEQLGLKLESERGAVDVLVIDHVERPTPD